MPYVRIKFTPWFFKSLNRSGDICPPPTNMASNFVSKSIFSCATNAANWAATKDVLTRPCLAIKVCAIPAKISGENLALSSNQYSHFCSWAMARAITIAPPIKAGLIASNQEAVSVNLLFTRFVADIND